MKWAGLSCRNVNRFVSVNCSVQRKRSNGNLVFLFSFFFSSTTSTTYASTITTSSPTMIVSPMAKSMPFSGVEEECNGFLLQCSLYIEMQPHLYSTERSKVSFIISLLSGKVLQWAETIWAQSSNIIQSFDNFVAHFREVFGRPYGDPSTSDQLYHLRQGSLPIKEYALRFRTLAAAGMNNHYAILFWWITFS